MRCSTSTAACSASRRRMRSSRSRSRTKRRFGSGRMSGHDEIRALATRLLDSIERGDVEAVADCYAPDVVIWHNTDGVEQGRDDNLKTLAAVVRLLAERRYEDRRLDVFDGGFVEQHVLSGLRSADGVRVSLPAV